MIENHAGMISGFLCSVGSELRAAAAVWVQLSLAARVHPVVAQPEECQMAVKAQRATECYPFACDVGRRGGAVRISCGRIASACVLAGWASSRPLAPPALSTFCGMMVRFTPRLPTNLELTAFARALCARRVESRRREHHARSMRESATRRCGA